MTREELESLLNRPESQSLDWKRDWPPELLKKSSDLNWSLGKGTLLKDLCAMANGIQEGEAHIVYGVKDHGANREVLGITQTWDDATFQTWFRNVFAPRLNCSYSEVEWERDAIVGIFRIILHQEAPHVAKQTVGGLHEGQVWTRRGTQNLVAGRRELEELFHGPEPVRSASSSGPVVEKTITHYRQLGLDPVLPNYAQRDDLLEQGYRLAFYPGTRRPVVLLNPATNEPDNLIMLRPNTRDTNGN